VIGLVKICGLTDAVAVGAAVEAGADAVGFVFAESARMVSPADAARLAADLPSTVRRVAVMRHPRQSEWQAVLEEFRPDVLQTDAADLDGLAVPEQLECWPVLREGTAVEDMTLPAVFLYEGAASGRGETVDWSRARAPCRRGRMILAGGLSADNVGRAIAAAAPWGVDVSSAVESAPGRKDPARIAEFIAAARAATIPDNLHHD